MSRPSSNVQSSSCPHLPKLQSYHTQGLLHRQDWLVYKAVARKDGCRVWNRTAGGQQTTLWLNHWCSALSSLSWGDTHNGCVCSSSGLGILTGLINKHSECSKCNWFLFHRKAENISHSTWSINQNTLWATRQYTNATTVYKCYSNLEKRNSNPISNHNKDLYRLCLISVQ